MPSYKLYFQDQVVWGKLVAKLEFGETLKEKRCSEQSTCRQKYLKILLRNREGKVLLTLSPTTSLHKQKGKVVFGVEHPSLSAVCCIRDSLTQTEEAYWLISVLC